MRDKSPPNFLVNNENRPLFSRKGLLVSVAMAAAFAVCPYKLYGEDTEFDRKTLAGLGAIEMLCDVEPEFPKALTDEELRTTTELRLRRAGIPFSDNKMPSGNPTLLISVNISRAEGANAYAYAISAELTQVVLLARDPSIPTSIPTWSSRVFGQLDERDLVMVKRIVESIVDEFANAYRSVNP